jgi:hypothetical protein
MSKLTDGFKNDQKITAKWCHYDKYNRPTVEWKPIPKDEYGTNAPQIGDDAGYVILQAFEKKGSRLKPIESSVTMGPFSPNDHKIILSYEISEYKWTIRAKLKGKETFKRNDVGAEQVDVNVEIGPKNP